MKKNIVKALSAIFGLTLLTASLAGCGSVKAVQANAAGTADTVKKEINEEKAPAAAATEDPVGKTKIKVHVSQGPAPYLYITDDGSPAGFDFAVFQEAISRLPQYEPEYISASDGLTGVYFVGNGFGFLARNFISDEKLDLASAAVPVALTCKFLVRRIKIILVRHNFINLRIESHSVKQDGTELRLKCRRVLKRHMDRVVNNTRIFFFK